MSSSPEVDSLRLTAADFDAYLPERATSNAFTAPRLALKERMLAWAGRVVVRLAELDVAVDVAASDEHPSLRNGRRVESQRVFFSRDAAARKQLDRRLEHRRPLTQALGDPAPHQKHLLLALRVDAQKVEVSLELHPDAWLDWRNLRALLGEPARTLALTTALESLPEQFTLGLASDTARIPASGATSDALRALVTRAEHEASALWAGWTISRDVALTHAELLVEQLEDAIVVLGPLQKLIAWAPDNDLGAVAGESDAAKAERERADDDEDRDRAERLPRVSRAEHEARSRGRHRSAPTPDDADAVSAEPPPGRHVPSGEPQDATAARPGAERPRALPRLLARRPLVTEVDPSVPIEKGTRVQVVAGPFRGKVGVVQELDGKGAARVMLGLLATRVEVKDLVAAAEGKDRPALASSHRKPMGVRS